MGREKIVDNLFKELFFIYLITIFFTFVYFYSF